MDIKPLMDKINQFAEDHQLSEWEASFINRAIKSESETCTSCKFILSDGEKEPCIFCKHTQISYWKPYSE